MGGLHGRPPIRLAANRDGCALHIVEGAAVGCDARQPHVLPRGLRAWYRLRCVEGCTPSIDDWLQSPEIGGPGSDLKTRGLALHPRPAMVNACSEVSPQHKLPPCH